MFNTHKTSNTPHTTCWLAFHNFRSCSNFGQLTFPKTEIPKTTNLTIPELKNNKKHEISIKNYECESVLRILIESVATALWSRGPPLDKNARHAVELSLNLKGVIAHWLFL